MGTRSVKSRQVQEALSSIEPSEIIDTAVQLCAVPSLPGDEGPLADKIAQLLNRPRIQVKLHPSDHPRPNVLATVSSTNGSAGASLVLVGHLYSFIVPGWVGDPYRPVVESGLVRGGGITDAKAGLAAMITAAHVTARLPKLPTTLHLLFTVKDGRISTGAKTVLSSMKPTPRYGVCVEGTNLAVHTAHGGSIEFEISVQGRPAHVTHLEDAVDALSAATDICQALRRADIGARSDPRLPNLPRLVIDALHAETWTATAPGEATIRGNVRTPRGVTDERLLGDLQAAVQTACPLGVRAETRLLASTPPFEGKVGGDLIRAISMAHQIVRGTRPMVSSGAPMDAAVTDAAEMARAGVETVIYGPGRWRYQAEESVPVDEIVDAARAFVATAFVL